MTFGRETDADESVRIVHAALDKGVDFVDTAEVYQDGVSETIVGRALEGGRRDRVFLATKVMPHNSVSLPDGDLSRLHLRRACEGSLRRLGTDRIDLYIMHRPARHTPIEETLAGLEQLTREGKILFAGVSMFPSWQMADMLSAAARHGWNPIVNVQSRYSLVERGVEDEVLPFCAAHGVGLTAYSPLAGGVLTGKYARGGEPPADTRAGAFGRFRRMLDDRTFAIVEECRAVAGARGLGPHHAALAWACRQAGVASAIIGARSLAQLEDTARGFDLELSGEEIARLERVSQRPDWAV
jgi:aryl-alcohol dehydrogenase-like predicted oxidoreductase